MRWSTAVVSVKNELVWTDRWENQDHGGTMVRGDGTFYCDMTGSGSDDYIVSLARCLNGQTLYLLIPSRERSSSMHSEQSPSSKTIITGDIGNLGASSTMLTYLVKK